MFSQINLPQGAYSRMNPAALQTTSDTMQLLKYLYLVPFQTAQGQSPVWSPAAFHRSPIGLELHPSDVYRYFSILGVFNGTRCFCSWKHIMSVHWPKPWHSFPEYSPCPFPVTQKGLGDIQVLSHISQPHCSWDLSYPCTLQKIHPFMFRQSSWTLCLYCEIRFTVHRCYVIFTLFCMLEYATQSYPKTCSYQLYDAKGCTNSCKSPNIQHQLYLQCISLLRVSQGVLDKECLILCCRLCL